MTIAELRRDAPWSLWTLTLIAVTSHLLLLSGGAIGPWTLPAAMIVAALLHRPIAPNLGHPCLVILATTGACAITYGAIATLDRSWDGLATWTANARWLAVDGSINHAYFTDVDVFNYARGYPLLQPVLLALGMDWLGEHGGRVLFPLLWLMLVLALPGPLQRIRLSERRRHVAVAGLLLTPFFLEPGGGGADSGFADLLVAALLLHAAIGLIEDRPVLMACACLLLPMAKIEGSVHMLNALFVASVSARRRSAFGGAVGGTLGLALTLPLQHFIRTPGRDLTAEAMLLTLAPAALVLFGATLRHRSIRPLVLTVGLAAVAAAALLLPATSSPFTQIVSRAASMDLCFHELPRILGSTLLALVQIKEFGVTFVLVIATACALAASNNARPMLPLAGMLMIGIAAIIVFLATRPIATLELFLYEGLQRYVAHWIGVSWLFVGLGWERLRSERGAVHCEAT